jgi:hypothetical protein
LLENNTSAVQACIGCVQDNSQIDKIVVGVESVNQLMQIIDVIKKTNTAWPSINCSDEHLINPSNWKSM